MDSNLVLEIFKVIGAVFSITIGSAAAAFAQYKVISQTMESMARQPEVAKNLHGSMLLGLAMIESLAIYCLLVSLILLMA